MLASNTRKENLKHIRPKFHGQAEESSGIGKGALKRCMLCHKPWPRFCKSSLTVVFDARSASMAQSCEMLLAQLSKSTSFKNPECFKKELHAAGSIMHGLSHQEQESEPPVHHARLLSQKAFHVTPNGSSRLSMSDPARVAPQQGRDHWSRQLMRAAKHPFMP